MGGNRSSLLPGKFGMRLEFPTAVPSVLFVVKSLNCFNILYTSVGIVAKRFGRHADLGTMEMM